MENGKPVGCNGTIEDARAAAAKAAVKDDPKDVLASIPAIKEIHAKVNAIKAKWGYKEDKPNNNDSNGVGADDESKMCGEDWIPRNVDMNRLTGAFPFDAEAPLSLLRDHGFITPATIHYVRNHGVVPKLSFFEHSITISGLVDKPFTLSMRELVKMPTITMPVTLNCAGNRRKEQNIIKKGIGFDWGCAAASTAIWTGVPLHLVLERAGIKSKDAGALWVNFNSPPGEVPRDDKTYGASHTRDICMNPARCAMLAFLMNGDPLHPDHGYPVRLLIPGFIGGRMIKWLDQITVTEKEGQNWYHIYDNRVFPKNVTTREVATNLDIWTDTAYRIDDRNIQSIIWSPAHCEKVPLARKTYTLGGYAYNGSGKAPDKVMVTLNGGDDWRSAKIARKADSPDHTDTFGMNFCWIHWELEVPVADLAKTGEIAVAAWDGQNTQPEKPTWNLMGMMNNPWFRVKVKAVPGEEMIWFEHPTRVEKGQDVAYQKNQLYVLDDGSLPSAGWMSEMKEKVQEVYAPKWSADNSQGVEELMPGKGWEHFSGRRSSFFNPVMVMPVAESPPPGCFEHIFAMFGFMRIGRKNTYHTY